MNPLKTEENDMPEGLELEPTGGGRPSPVGHRLNDYAGKSKSRRQMPAEMPAGGQHLSVMEIFHATHQASTASYF
jgi:hypothetical protein